MPGLLDFISLRDMIDGGGAGRSGQRFEGGPLSGLLNDLGIRPLGYNDRMDEAAPMGLAAAPPAPAMAPRPAPQANPYAPGAITMSTLPPMGQMPNEELIRMLLQAIQSAPRATGYGPR